MSAAQYLVDAATRHQVFLQRYGGGKSKEAQRVLNRLRRDISARLSREPTIFQRQRLTDILKDINALSTLAFKDISGKMLQGAKELASVEAEFSTTLFNKVVNVEFTLPSDAALLNAVVGSAMDVGLNAGVTIPDALSRFSVKKAEQITRAVTDGIAVGDTTQQIAKKLGTMIDTLHKRQIDALARTIVNHAASASRDLVYKENSDIMDGYRWVATLDSKTTMICGSRDGVVYKNPTDPTPPAHYNCRSTTVPVIKPEYDIGAGLSGRRPSIGGSGAKSVSSRTTYGGWLKKQPVSFVDEALGIERSKMFRSGKLSIGKFVDPTGRVYTIDQLKSMNPIAFAEF